MCADCDQLAVDFPIRTPADLSRSLRLVRASLADGTLVEEPATADRALYTSAMRDLPDDGPWPDYVELRFRCRTCGSRFKLTAETYHGAGGRWGRVERAV